MNKSSRNTVAKVLDTLLIIVGICVLIPTSIGFYSQGKYLELVILLILSLIAIGLIVIGSIKEKRNG